MHEHTEYVVHTYYQKTDGDVVAHAFGPYPSRNHAAAARKKLLRTNSDEIDREREAGSIVSIKTTRLIKPWEHD